MRLKTLPIFLAFFLMGLADAMGPNSDKVKDFYHISNVQSTLLSFAVFIAFAVFSVPGGLLAARIGEETAAVGFGPERGFAGDPVRDGAQFLGSLGLHLPAGRWHNLPASLRQSDHAQRQRRGEVQPQSGVCTGHQGHRQLGLDVSAGSHCRNCNFQQDGLAAGSPSSAA